MHKQYNTVSFHLGSRAGFTIVELLVVIVVIAILAAITVVAFNGIQDRAQGVKAASALDAYVKALDMYYLQNGTYPDDGRSFSCLGEVSNYPANSTFADGECYGPADGSGKGTSYVGAVSSTLNSALKSYLGTLPDGSVPATTSGYTARGLIYESSNDQTVNIMYFLKGSGQSCGQGKAMASGSTTTCYITLYRGVISS